MVSSFNKKSIASTVMALCLVFLVGCSSSVKTPSVSSNTTNAITNTTNSNVSSTNDVTNTSSINNSPVVNNTGAVTTNERSSQPSTTNYADIAAKVKNYILNGQGNKSSAERLNWSEAFLNEVDIKSLYNRYIASGGEENNIVSFAQYITFNSPVTSNWKDLFEKNYYASYKNLQYTVKISRYEYLGDDLYQVYVVNNGKETPDVVVSSRTGNYHG